MGWSHGEVLKNIKYDGVRGFLVYPPDPSFNKYMLSQLANKLTLS